MDVAYRLKITLARTRPPIWRRVLVPQPFTLLQLHVLVQRVMGWEDRHLHEFAQRHGRTTRCFMRPELLEELDHLGNAGDETVTQLS